MDKQDNNNVLSMRDYKEAIHMERMKENDVTDEINRRIKESRPKPNVSGDLMTIGSIRKTVKQLSISSIQEAIHYEYQATKEVLVTFESKDHLFKMLKRVGLAELLRVKYCNLDNPVIKEFFEHIKKE